MSLTPWGTQVVVEVSSAAPSAAIPTWVDISDYAKPPISVNRGRQTDLPGLEPSTADLYLIDNDARFVVGNPLSPYTPWWKEGRRIRVKEILPTATPTVIPLIDGYISTVQSDVSMETLDGQTDRVTHVSVIDGLGRAQSAPAFISTLAAHIMGSATASGLANYWPMGESVMPVQAVVGSGNISASPAIHSMGTVISYATALLALAAGPSVGADDLTPPKWLCDVDASGNALGYQEMKVTLPATLTVASTVTLVAWVYVDTTDGVNSTYPFFLSGTSPPGPSASQGFIYLVQLSPGSWSVQFIAGASTLLLAVPSPKTNGWSLVAAQMTVPSGACTVWIDGTSTTGTLSGSPPSTVYFDVLELGQFFAGSLAHVQIYTGASFDYAAFAAQRDVGLQGLDRQTASQRIHRIADYIGFPPDRRDIDPGVAVMLPARLAGRKASDAWETARATEGGRLFFSGDGRLVFHDRRRVLNV